MRKLIIIFLTLLPGFLFLATEKDKQYPYKNGIPTSKGILYYVKVNEEKIVNEYYGFIKDTLYSYYIEVDDLSLYTDYDSLESGRFYIPDEIIITSELKYTDYELKFLPKWKRNSLVENNEFVKAVMIHELTHVYFYQIIQEMQIRNMEVAYEYTNFRIIPMRETYFGSEFIEEGVCEYITQKSGEVIPYQNITTPKTREEILDKNNSTNIKYKYSSAYVKDFLDLTTKQYGSIKEGIIILLRNKPPTYEEILYPNLFFNRLK